MAVSEYLLLVSLSAGIHAHADIHDISIGPDVISQPNGGGPVASTRVAKDYKELNTRSTSRQVASVKSISPATQTIKLTNSVRPPTIKTPSIRVM